jgi:CBS domain containing-hemolysin-like protein
VLAAMASEASWVWDVLGLLAVPALVVLNGLFVATEFSLVAVRRTRIEELVAQNVTGAATVQQAIANLNRTIAVTQLGITLASIALGWTGEPALARLLQPLFHSLPLALGEWVVHSTATVVAFLAITFMHVVLGEMVPKAMALQTPDRTALWLATPLMVFAKLVRPLVVVMNATGNWVLRKLGYEAAAGTDSVHSVQELALLIEDTEEAGILDSDQAEFVQNVFRLSDKHVRDCMISRDKMGALELNTPSDKVLEAVRNGAHTRMPVYEGEIDNIVGIVNTKNLFFLFSQSGVVVLEDALYPALFLKPDEDIATGLKLFRQARRPMAVVRDDAGHVQGLITLEDILEEIVGDIEDEHDRPVPKAVLRMRRPKTGGKPAPPSKQPPPPSKQAPPSNPAARQP